MAESGVIFPRKDAARIARTVKAHERTPSNLVGPRQPFRKPGHRVEFVKVTTAASGGGKYNGRVLQPRTGAAVTATGNLAESDFGALPDADNALVLNAQEVGKTTHDLTTGTPVSKIFVGIVVGTTSDGKLVVGINGTDWEDCA